MQQKRQMPFVFKMQGQTSEVEETRKNVQLEIKIGAQKQLSSFVKLLAYDHDDIGCQLGPIGPAGTVAAHYSSAARVRVRRLLRPQVSLHL
jgi:hypothetical protein